MNKKICIITNGYPTKDDPVYAFIQPLAREMADAGISCTVIAPQSVSKMAVAKKVKRPYQWIDRTEKGNEVVIYQPEYVSVSNVTIFGYRLSTIMRDASIKKCFYKEKMSPDVLYAHFWDCGVAACKLAERTKTPVFVATGESEIRVPKYYPPKYIDRYLPYVTGVIAVSTKNLEESRGMGLLKHCTKTIVLPNAFNPSEFYSISKVEARKSLNMDINAKIAIFVGAFSERKGISRVIEAAKQIPDLQLILIGSNEKKYTSEQVIFSGKLPHHDIVKYLNAADVFVLPTRAEGCCNAIIEALACGLPVISSNLPFNKDVLDNSCSILVDPDNIKEISNALKTLVTDYKLRTDLSYGSLEKSKELTISNRAKSIISFIKKC